MIATPEQVARLVNISLYHGSHEAGEQMCAMEAAAYIASEPWSDHPECVCPTIGAFMRSWNDSLPDNETRDRLLLPLIPVVLNTRSTKADEERRSYMALDWLIRVHTPKFLDLVPSLAFHAKALRDLEEICDLAGATAAGKLTNAARDAAWDAAGAAAGAAARDAARDAAWDAAGAAAGAAARDAARDAAWDAAGAAARAAAGAAAWAAARADAGAAAWAAARADARDAAWDAAGAAARDAARAAARDAARAAARDALKPTVEWLQISASQLVRDMCAYRGAT